MRRRDMLAGLLSFAAPVGLLAGPTLIRTGSRAGKTLSGWNTLGQGWTITVDKARALLRCEHRDGAWFRVSMPAAMDMERVFVREVCDLANRVAWTGSELVFRGERGTDGIYVIVDDASGRWLGASRVS